ncbi:helix-turn-helix transcriptional regulator [Streptomyces sp. ISL-112]|uniref:helix-turn-helix domain-containing protein n=1 Tax=unclassified Streptomyces TaxID=2593676 RepID=UPI001BE8F75C|nr:MULTISPECIES: helix-turn-helix transcriptional regulator [unclassified Streptomyces]MBT2426135.1 helix-turn-helix transcriptional regulator [Streptomyces sp. ISL-112]MBT2461326.1 helix-turn-helix transcriptional regulator [Streptomyces sp. ISL-63]
MPEPLTAVEQVAANVKLLRTRRGWTQNQLAAEMGQKFSQVVATTEGGKRRITVDDLVDFAKAFGVTPEQMMSDDPDAGHQVYEVAVDGGNTQSFAADTVDPGETWTSFYLRETRVFLAPTARILGIRLITEEAPDA